MENKKSLKERFLEKLEKVLTLAFQGVVVIITIAIFMKFYEFYSKSKEKDSRKEMSCVAACYPHPLDSIVNDACLCDVTKSYKAR